MTTLYFTATGNCLYIAKTIGGRLISIPKAIKDNNLNFKDDKIGIIFPIYGATVPQYIKEFLQQVQFDSQYIFAVMSYGMSGGAAVDNLVEITARKNIFSYINTVKMIDNYVPNFYLEKQIKTEPKKQIDKYLKTIADDVRSGKQWIRKSSFIEKIITKKFSGLNVFATGIGVTDKFRVENSCTECGICAKVCPTDNIKVEEAKPVFAHNCLSCLACTHHCPQNVIRLSNEKSEVRFRNQHVSLKEIIDSNI